MARQPILQVDGKGRVTLPPEVRKKSHGLFTYEIAPNGVVQLKPILGVVTSDQAYFWSGRWQDGEKEASEDVKKGRMKRVPFSKLKTFLSKV